MKATKGKKRWTKSVRDMVEVYGLIRVTSQDPLTIQGRINCVPQVKGRPRAMLMKSYFNKGAIMPESNRLDEWTKYVLSQHFVNVHTPTNTVRYEELLRESIEKITRTGPVFTGRKPVSGQIIFYLPIPGTFEGVAIRVAEKAALEGVTAFNLKSGDIDNLVKSFLDGMTSGKVDSGRKNERDIVGLWVDDNIVNHVNVAMKYSANPGIAFKFNEMPDRTIYDIVTRLRPEDQNDSQKHLEL